jgi:hypothetical protein
MMPDSPEPAAAFPRERGVRYALSAPTAPTLAMATSLVREPLRRAR